MHLLAEAASVSFDLAALRSGHTLSTVLIGVALLVGAACLLCGDKIKAKWAEFQATRTAATSTSAVLAVAAPLKPLAYVLPDDDVTAGFGNLRALDEIYAKLGVTAAERKRRLLDGVNLILPDSDAVKPDVLLPADVAEVKGGAA